MKLFGVVSGGDQVRGVEACSVDCKASASREKAIVTALGSRAWS